MFVHEVVPKGAALTLSRYQLFTTYHIQKEETQKLIRRKLAVGWKLKVTRDTETGTVEGKRSKPTILRRDHIIRFRKIGFRRGMRAYAALRVNFFGKLTLE